VLWEDTRSEYGAHMDRSAVVVVRLPEGLLRQLDGMVARGRYLSRSEVVRALVRSGVAATEIPPWLPSGGSEGASESDSQEQVA
jgi:Arc/MetJ-type ribon-helix-helix transcriptional regulator